MTFTSYAQNFEDVLLWRALHDVVNGCYIDIGAQDPVADSISLAFYEAGWRGVHLEATPFFANRLREARPDEVVIEAAVSDEPGPIDFYEIPGTGLSTGKADIAQQHTRRGYNPRQITVATLRLDQILEKYRDVHWLKIDVEGMEANVLASWGTNAVRPWIVVVEATTPLEQTFTDGPWRDQLTKRGYVEVHFDGLSRYFVHESQSRLTERFQAPPNIFDGFQVTRRHFSTQTLAREICEQQAAAVAKLTELEAGEEHIRAEVSRLTASLQAADHANASLTRELSEARRDLEQATATNAAAQREHQLTVEGLRAEWRDSEKTLITAHSNRERQLWERIDTLELEIEAALEREADLERRVTALISENHALELRASLATQQLSSASALIRQAVAQPETRWQRFGRALGVAGPAPVVMLLRAWQPPSGETPMRAAEAAMSNASDQDERTDFQVSSLPELLATDGIEFVRTAYVNMLGREADETGEEYYLGRLQGGYSKLQILFQLRQSSEARLFPDPLPGLDRAFRQFRLKAPLMGKRRAAKAVEKHITDSAKLTHVEDFMQYYDEQFVTVLYLYYLGREPDSAGLRYYTDRVRRGASRQQVLLEVARSNEARALGRRAVGEGSISAAVVVDRIPILRTIVAVLRFNLRVRRHLQDLRAFQNHLYRLSQRVS